MIVEYTDPRGTHICTVRGQSSTYVIEPYRHSIGVTRAAMVDEHLSQLVGDPTGHHPDQAVLEAARARFVRDAHPRRRAA